MRWFKHLSSTHADSGIQVLMSRWGMWGYAAFFLILETICYHWKPGGNPEVELPVRTWCEILHCKPKILDRFLVDCHNVLGTLSERNNNVFKTFPKRKNNVILIRHPKLLIYQDEYFSRSGQTRDKLPSKNIEVELEVERTKRTVPSGQSEGSDLDKLFRLWNGLPGLIHHRSLNGQSRFLSSALKVYSLADVQLAIQRYSHVRTNAAGAYREVYSWTLGEFVRWQGGANIQRFSASGDWEAPFRARQGGFAGAGAAEKAAAAELRVGAADGWLPIPDIEEEI